MDLSWLVAVLQPHDVAMQIDDREADAVSAPGYLAAMVLGNRRHFPYPHQANIFDAPPLPDPALKYVQQTFNTATISYGLIGLSNELDKNSGDLARDCSLTLLACCAAAELDNFDLCIILLDNQVRRTANAKTSNEKLIQAILLQQKSIRLRDFGQPHEEVNRRSLRLLNGIRVNECSPFKPGPAASNSNENTLKDIVATIYNATWYLHMAGKDVEARLKLEEQHSWPYDEPPETSNYLLENDQQAAEIYSDFVSQLYNQNYQRTQTWIFGGPRIPDLFYRTLALELIGHPEVYRARRELAQLRFVQSSINRNYSDLGDGLRLFRHAAVKNELDVALRSLRASGPLEALSSDCRRIIQYRLEPERLRSVELRVLEASAELLTPNEAEVALEAILRSLAAGGPPDLPNEWEIAILRLEIAWRAAASLAGTAGRENDIAELLYQEASAAAAGDQVRDSAIARAAVNLNWSNVSGEVKERWRQWLARHGEDMPATADVAASFLGHVVPANNNDHPDLDNIRINLNSAMQGTRIDGDVVERFVPIVRSNLRDIREAAARGVHSFYSISIADIAAGLILYAGASDLWTDLTEFLSDTTVPRMARSPAFERLARGAIDLPPEAKERFSGNVSRVLNAPDIGVEQSSAMIPYPEALRFFGVTGIINDTDTLALTAKLAGIPYRGRQEAARTIAMLARHSPRQWIFALAFDLSHDHDSEAKAYAGQCLARMADSTNDLASPSNNRLIELLNEDGLLIPVVVLRALDDLGSDLSGETKAYVQSMSESHPSRLVRLQAARLARKK